MSSAPPACDWQTSRKHIQDRGAYLLENGIWSDCRFIVGTEPNQRVIEGHKLFLAMASPVFDAMFYGGMAEKDPIVIPDVQPDAFRALLEYIYTDKINLTSFDQACELCYGAKKYMLPHLVEECTTYLWSDLYPKNACRAYEFAKLFEEPVLMDKCFDIICNQTQEVLSESSFDDVELSTIVTIFDKENLNIDSELQLFNALTKYSSRHNTHGTGAKMPRLDGIDAASTSGSSGGNNEGSSRPTVRDALMKIRFLTLSPQQFAEGPASSNLLSQNEKFSILMNISSSSTDVPMPPGFNASKQPRQKKVNGYEPYFGTAFPRPETRRPSLIAVYGQSMGLLEENASGDGSRKMYCTRQLLSIAECMNNSVLDCSVTFTSDKNVCVYGIQVPAQVLMDVDERQQQSFSNSTYTELLYAHLLDADGSRLTYTHFTSRVSYRSFIDITFNRPVYIQKHKLYKAGVVLNKVGWYPIASCPSLASCNGVVFTFGQGTNADSVRDGLIRSIIFSLPPPACVHGNVANTDSSTRGGPL